MEDNYPEDDYLEDNYLWVRAERRGHLCVLRVGGDLDAFTAGWFTAEAEKALLETPGRVLVDLSRLDFIDAAGTRALAAVARSIPRWRLAGVRGCQPRVCRVLDLAGLDLAELCSGSRDGSTTISQPGSPRRDNGISWNDMATALATSSRTGRIPLPLPAAGRPATTYSTLNWSGIVPPRCPRQGRTLPSRLPAPVACRVRCSTAPGWGSGGRRG